MVVAVVLCHHTGILLFRCLDNFQSDHYSRTPTGSILDLTTIFRFPVDCNIHWQAMVDPMAALPIPPGHGLVDANFIGWKKFCARCSLKFLTKSSTSLQRYCSDVISDGRLGGCSLNRMHIHRSSNRFRGIPVRPNDGAGMYLLVVTLLQSDARDPNSKRVTSNMTPKNFTISPAVV